MTQERRQFPRIWEMVDLKYRIAGDISTSWVSVTTTNLSAGGMRFRNVTPLEPATQLILQFSLPGIAEPINVNGMVVWKEMQASGVSESGVEFTGLKDEERRQIDQFVAFLSKGA